MKESALQEKIVKAMRASGAFVVKIHGSQFGSGGTPDLLVCSRGRFFAFEIKAGNNVATPLQQQRIDEIRKAGGIALICRSVDDALGAINV